MFERVLPYAQLLCRVSSALALLFSLVSCAGDAPNPPRVWAAIDMPIEYVIQYCPSQPSYQVLNQGSLSAIYQTMAEGLVAPRWDWIEDSVAVTAPTDTHSVWLEGEGVWAQVYLTYKDKPDYQYFLMILSDYRDPSDPDMGTSVLVPGLTVFTSTAPPGVIPAEKYTFMFYNQMDRNVDFTASWPDSPDYNWLCGWVAHEFGHQRAGLRHPDDPDDPWWGFYHSLNWAYQDCLMRTVADHNTVVKRTFCHSDDAICGGGSGCDSSCIMYLRRTSGY
jgi:hypothetical protein